MSRLPQKAFSLLLVILLAWQAPLQYWARAGEAERHNKEQREKIAEQLEKLFDALEQAAREIPRDTFDPKAIVQKVGTDPEKLFEWVRDNTYWVPYRGSLRGPIGVLMDRLGNSLDRSLLLAELLSSTGHRVRLARAELSLDQAEALLAKIRPVPKEPIPTGEEYDLQEIEELAQASSDRYGLDAAQLRGVFCRSLVERQRMQEELAQRVAEQTPVLLDAVGRPDKAHDPRPAQLAALRDHCWVQWESENGLNDLDPLLPDAKPTKAVADDATTIEPDELSDDLLHLIDIRIVIEQCTKGKLKEHTVLEYTFRPSELFEQRVSFSHYPMNWPKDLNLHENREDVLHSLKKAVLDQDEWLPVLRVGHDTIFQCSITDKGEVNKNPDRESAARVGGALGGIFGGAFGAFGGGAPKNKREKNSLLTAEWIEYQVRVPGEPVRRIRRQIFDLLGPAARQTTRDLRLGKLAEQAWIKRGLALLGEKEILFLACRPSAEYIDQLYVKRMLAIEDTFIGVLGKPFQATVAELAKTLPLPGPEYRLALERWELSRCRGCAYLDYPNVLSYDRSLRLGTNDDVSSHHGFDIVCNRVAVVPQSNIDTYLVRLEQGVLDTNAESLLMDESADCLKNTGLVYARARAQTVEWLALRDKTDPAWRMVELPQDIRFRIERDLADGYVVVTPNRPILFRGQELVGWWRVDPKTGETLGIGANGAGQGIAEYTDVTVWLIGAVFCVFQSEGSRLALVECGFGLGLGFIAVGRYTAMFIIARIFAAIAIGLGSGGQDYFPDDDPHW
jgi:hypothetical protein